MAKELLRCALTPDVETWAVQVIEHEGGYATVFSVDHQHFTLAQGGKEEHSKEHCEFIRDQFLVALQKVLPFVVCEVDVDGVISPDGQIQYIGKARRQPSGKYTCLARVGEALCVVEVTFSAKREG